MTSQKILAQGAEAKIILDLKNQLIIKDRIKKSYRISELDNKIRKRRTKSETKLLKKVSEIISCPKLLESKNKYQIIMSFIKGKKLSEELDNFSLKKQKLILNLIGKNIAKLHDHHIIHGDLTTSNMILVEKEKYFEEEVKKIKKLKLPQKKYAVFGSGPLAVKGIRKSNDIDIIVKKDLWKKLSQKYKKEIHNIGKRKVKLIKIGKIEIYPNWDPWIKDINKIIEDAEIIQEIPFAKLDDVLIWKKKYNRKKDLQDINLIKDYKSNKQNFKIFFIDFGLGFQNGKYEDKAVDLYLLKQALEAKHFKNWEILFKEFLKAYKFSKNYEKTIQRLKAVEKRRRYKH